MIVILVIVGFLVLGKPEVIDTAVVNEPNIVDQATDQELRKETVTTKQAEPEKGKIAEVEDMKTEWTELFARKPRPAFSD